MTKLEFLHKVTSRLRYKPIWMPILEASGQKIKNKNWIFIVGCYNSGTTLLDQILASHPEISGLPDEGVMLTNQLVRPEDFGWRRMWSECFDEMKNSKRNRNKNSYRIQKHWSHFYDLERNYLVEKSISNITRIEFLNNNFKPNVFIHIVRNGYAVAEGIRRKSEIMHGNPYKEKEEYPIELCAKQWIRSIELFIETRKNLKNVIEISYEELSEHPSQTVNKILDWLGVRRFSEEYFTHKFEIHEKKEKIKNMNLSSFKRLSDNDYEKINRVAQIYLEKYNYEILS